ncbi:MAG: methyltransferase domain-containing protein [Burkholderiales bacterium]
MAILSTPAGQWFQTPLGQYMLTREQNQFDQMVADVFGFNAIQIGMPEQDFLRASRIPLRCRLGPTAPATLRAEYRHLPIATASADLILLPHVLEFDENPHQILREVERALVPEGHTLICGFNPWSLWGVKKARVENEFPWSGSFINLPRLKDWLSLLGFEIEAGKLCCYVPPVNQERWLRRFDFMENAGDRWWPFAGAVYFLQAIKRVPGMRVIIPTWRDRAAPKKKLAAVPQRSIACSQAQLDDHRNFHRRSMQG